MAFNNIWRAFSCLSVAMAVTSATLAARVGEPFPRGSDLADEACLGSLQVKSGDETAGKRDPDAFSEVLKRELDPWLRRLQAADPEISLDSFVKRGEYGQRLHRYPHTPGSGFPFGEERLRERLYIYSPDKTKALDAYVQDAFYEKDGVVSIWREVDSEVGLIDFEKKERTPLFFCGTSCGFEAAAWLDDYTLVVARLEVVFDDSPSTVYRTLFTLYSTSDHKYTAYEGPPVALKDLIKAPDAPLQQRLEQTFPNIKK